MRRFHRSRGRMSRGRKGRKYVWEGGFVIPTMDLGAGLNNSMQYVFWIKWPSGLEQTTTETGIDRSGELTPVDETLVRLRWIIAWTGTFSKANATYEIGFGATTYEDHLPGAVDNIVATGGPGGGSNPWPDPLDNPGEDWIFRRADAVHIGNAVPTTLGPFGFLNTDLYESRAQRKLPFGLGILGIVSCVGNNGAGDDEISNFTPVFDVRALYKSGIYAG